jgi:hypothetical protein
VTILSGIRSLLAVGTMLGVALPLRTLLRSPVLTAAVAPPQVSLPAGKIKTAANADSLSRSIASRDPFRADRRPSPVSFDPTQPDGGPARPAAAPRPTFVVTGILLGNSPSALIEGFPGMAGTRLINVGERIGDYRLREVTADHAVITGKDTTWVIRVRGRTL